jgi:hypothetical protein
VNVCVPRIHMLKSKPPMSCIKKWGVRKIIRNKNGTLKNSHSALTKNDLRACLHLSSPYENTMSRWLSVKQEEYSQMAHNLLAP